MQPSDVSATVAEQKEKEKKRPSVSVFKLFSFADFYDCVLMTLGSIGACIHGASVPVFFIFFGKLINIIGLAYLFPQEASHKVAKVIYIYIFIIAYPKLKVLCLLRSNPSICFTKNKTVHLTKKFDMLIALNSIV